MKKLHIQEKPTGTLRAHPHNVHVHPKKQIRLLIRLIRRFGFTVPIIIDENGVILAGHGRWLAAQELALETVPVIVLSGLSEAERRSFLLSDNKVAEKAGWDRAALALELNSLAPLLVEAGLDISLTGFEAAEIDSLSFDLVDPEIDPVDEPSPLERKSVSRLGDLWLLGSHRFLCGNALETAHLRKLMSCECASMVFADPPYNVSIKSIQGRGKIQHGEFAMASGEMSKVEFTRFLIKALGLAVHHSIEGSIHFVCMDWRHLEEILEAGNSVFSELKNLVVWNKTNAGQGSFYRSQHELIFVFKSGEVAHTNNFGLGQHGRNRSNVWTYAGVNTFRAGRLDELSIHPTVKPVALVADAMRDCSRRGDIVLDPFMGSGTTIVAGERVGRRAYGLELDPLYVDAAVRRWQGFTKRDAILDGSGMTFDEVATARATTKSRGRK